MSNNEERRFLHDIASPLGTVFFLVDAAIESLKEKLNGETDEVTQLQDAYAALQQVKQMIQSRRQILIERENKTK
jgi:FtsZ-binding cell division protein ZapB